MVVGALVVTGVVAWMLRRVVPAWNTPHTAIEGIEHARSTVPPAEARARRLVFVVVDGLGWDHARDLETLAPLAREGVARPMIASFPTYTAGGVTAMVTGLSPRESGMRLNGAPTGPRGLDDILATAWDGGVDVRVRARDYPPFLWLVRSPAHADARIGRLLVLSDLAGWSFEPAPTQSPGRAVEIDAIHLGEVDDAGHAFGADSPEYREAALHAGTTLQAIVSRLDPERDMLLAVSDHGQRAARGHGGAEPEVEAAFLLAWGHGIKRGEELGPRHLRDVAPTLAVALGVHTPSSSMGVPMIDMFDGTSEERARLLEEPLDQLARFDRAQLEACAPSIERARTALAEGRADDAEAAMLATSRAIDDERDRSASTATTPRLVAGFLAAIAILLVASFRAPRWPNVVLVPLVAWGPYIAFLVSKGYGPTLSAMAPGSVFITDAWHAVAATLPAIAFVAGRHRLGLRDALWLGATTLATLVVILAWTGANPRSIANPVAGAFAFQLAPLVFVAGLGGVTILAIDRWWR